MSIQSFKRTNGEFIYKREIVEQLLSMFYSKKTVDTTDGRTIRFVEKPELTLPEDNSIFVEIEEL